MIFLGSDHRGFELKEKIKQRLQSDNFNIVDLGNDRLDPSDDYVDFAQKVAVAVAENPDSFGVLFCGSGVGVDIVANKIDGIRSALVSDIARAKQSREHEDANVLSLPADLLDQESAFEIIQIFLNTAFSDEERHQRRLEKLKLMESTDEQQ